MRIIQLTQRTARMLRDNLTANQEGYDFTDLVRLDGLAKRLTTLQGEYAVTLAEMSRDERKIRRALVRAASPAEEEQSNRALLALRFDVDDLNEVASQVAVEFRVEDGDHKLIRDKVDAVGHWIGTDDVRPFAIAMVEAVRNAEVEGAEGEEPVDLKARQRKA